MTQYLVQLDKNDSPTGLWSTLCDFMLICKRVEIISVWISIIILVEVDDDEKLEMIKEHRGVITVEENDTGYIL